MKKYVKLFIFVMIMFACLFVNINGAKADGGYCSVGANIQEAYACDYQISSIFGNMEYTIFFVKTSDGYCSELSQLDLYIDGSDWGVLQFASEALGGEASTSYDEERRRITTFELNDTYDDVFNSKTCPQIKSVVSSGGFGSTSVKSLIFTTPKFGDNLNCFLSSNIAYWDSFCLISDGSNFRSVSKEETEQTVEDAQDDRDGANLEKIKWWAEDNGYDNVDSLGDDCSIISNSLKDILSSAFWIICIAGIILVVVMTAIGFIKAITGSDDEKFRDAIKNLFTRLIVIIILLMLPALLTFIINIINSNITGTVSIGEDGNVFCDISK